MFPEIMVIPMREELSRLGIQELRTAAEVDRLILEIGGMGDRMERALSAGGDLL